MASMAGQTECVELLLKAKADPHVKESMNYGNDPEDGRTAMEFAKAGDLCFFNGVALENVCSKLKICPNS